LSRIQRHLSAVGLIIACSACTQRPGTSGDAGRPWAAPSLDRATRIFDTHRQRQISLSTMLAELARADVVFLGETHLDETTHRVESAVYEGLIALRNGQVVLAMEMFERDDQPALDDYVAGKITEAEFIERTDPWPNYGSAYRPMIEAARREGLPVIGSNVPVHLRRKLAMGGQETFENLPEEQRALLPEQLLAHTPEYWARVDNAIRGHMGMLGSPEPPEPEDRLYTTQSLWDNSMAEACAEALDAHPGHLVLHINGSFHSSRYDGTVRQLRLRRPELLVKTIAVAPTFSLATAGAKDAGRVADYYILAEAVARDANEGFYAVNVPAELRYRLHVPESATDQHEVPLLIWLCDDGFSAADGLRLWKERLGERIAIAAIEPIYPAQQEDLAQGGRWYGPETFDQDLSLLETGLDEVWGYLLRNHPVDPEAVVLAGEGTGATVVAFASLFAGRMESRSVAAHPRQFSKLRYFPLPLALDGGTDRGPSRELLVITDSASREWWQQELSDYARTGLADELVLATDDPWQRYRQVEQALAVRLGLPVPRPDEARTRRHIVLQVDTPRARLWARTYALSATDAATDVAIFGPGGPAAASEASGGDAESSQLPVDLGPSDFPNGKGFPLAPGPFGGTTVLVLPEGLDPKVSAEWEQFEEDGVLSRQHRFHRLRVAKRTGPDGLAAVLTQLKSENRKNILIVPARFCADPETMRTLRAETADLAEELTLHWQPGLGAGLRSIEPDSPPESPEVGTAGGR